MENEMETTIVYGGCMGIMEYGNYYSGFGVKGFGFGV